MSKSSKPMSGISSQGRQTLLDLDECRQIAAAFDGTTSCIDALLATWSTIKPGLKRHHITNAARRGGYQTTKDRKAWTPEEDKFLEDHWRPRR